MQPYQARALRALGLTIGLAAAFGPAGVHAQSDWPVKPVRLIVPFSAGGPTDLVARLIAPKLSESLGQQFIVDNRVGAGGNIGTSAVAKAAPDGYTLLVAGSSFPVNQSLFANAGYDADRDFTPISNLAVTPMIVVAHPETKVRTMREVASLAKGGSVPFATPGTGTLPHLLAELMNTREGTQLQLVHYKGGAQSTVSIVSGETKVALGAISSYMALVKAGKVTPIAVTSPGRHASLPDVPTVAEAGMPFLESEPIVGGFLAPRGTPAAIVDRLHGEIVKAANAPEVRERFRAAGIEVLANSGADFAGQIRADVARWAKVIKDAGVKTD